MKSRASTVLTLILTQEKGKKNTGGEFCTSLSSIPPTPKRWIQILQKLVRLSIHPRVHWHVAAQVPPLTPASSLACDAMAERWEGHYSVDSC